MCRLFACVNALAPLSMRETLGTVLLDEFARLSAVHKHGWGAATVGPGGRSFYQSTASVLDDRASFDSLAAKPVSSSIIHERWASPGIALVLDNQQPFMERGIAFAHNGTIENAGGNAVNRPEPWRDSLGLAGSFTMSDSKLYAELFMKRLAEAARAAGKMEASPPAERLVRALSETLDLLRADYPDSSYNNVIQTPDLTLVTRAHAANPRLSDGARRRYEEAGWAGRIDNYFEIKYAELPGPHGSVTLAASSSGYASTDSWKVLENDHALVFSHATGEARVYSL